jgi:hypothetical protein
MNQKPRKNNDIYIPTWLKAMLIATVALFAAVTMTLGGFLIAEAITDGSSEPVQSDGGGSSNKKNNSTKDTDSVQAGIVTPNKNVLYQSKISRDSYISSSNDSTANVSDIKSVKIEIPITFIINEICDESIRNKSNVSIIDEIKSSIYSNDKNTMKIIIKKRNKKTYSG